MSLLTLVVRRLVRCAEAPFGELRVSRSVPKFKDDVAAIDALIRASRSLPPLKDDPA